MTVIYFKRFFSFLSVKLANLPLSLANIVLLSLNTGTRDRGAQKDRPSTASPGQQQWWLAASSSADLPNTSPIYIHTCMSAIRKITWKIQRLRLEREREWELFESNKMMSLTKCQKIKEWNRKKKKISRTWKKISPPCKYPAVFF